MLRYADTPLISAGSDLIDYLRDAIDPSWLVQWTERTWPGADMEKIGWRGYWPKAPVRINTLIWPAGATRFAHGYFLADESGVTNIRDKAIGVMSGTSYKEDAVLHMSDGNTGREINTKMLCLPIRPLSQISTQVAGLYLITLVDDRYFWWQSIGQTTVDEGKTTWVNMYNQIAGFAGFSITVDPVDAAYLYPSKALAVTYRSLPILLDSIAYSCGQRVIRELDGTVRAINAKESLIRHQTNLTTYEKDRLAGNEMSLKV